MTARGRRWLVWALTATSVVAAIWLKVRVEAGQSLDHARSLEKQGETELAISVYRQTIRWYSPGSGPVSEAVDRLWLWGQSYEEAGDSTHALMAYRALRSGLQAIRSLWDPYSEKLPALNDRIAALMAQQDDRGAGSLAERTAHHRALLDVDHAPNRWWSLLAILMFALWIIALFGLALRGFDEETGALLRTPALRWLAFAIFGLLGWTLGLALA